LTTVLANAITREGVPLLPWMMVFDLLIEEGKAVGALVFNFRSGKSMALVSKTIVLANGGGGALYRRHDNPVRTTGDGYALAFLAGCQLRDMEFVQFMPSGLAEFGKPLLLIVPSLCDFGRVINSKGEDVLQKYQITEKPVAARARDSFSLAIFGEGAEGKDVKGAPHLGHLTVVSFLIVPAQPEKGATKIAIIRKILAISCITEYLSFS